MEEAGVEPEGSAELLGPRLSTAAKEGEKEEGREKRQGKLPE